MPGGIYHFAGGLSTPTVIFRTQPKPALVFVTYCLFGPLGERIFHFGSNT